MEKITGGRMQASSCKMRRRIPCLRSALAIPVLVTASHFIFNLNVTLAQCEFHEDFKLSPSSLADHASFGYAVSIDGDAALVGATGSPCPNGVRCGAAYVYRRLNGNEWFEEQKITAADAGLLDGFGNSVSISGDLAVIGAFQDNCAVGQDCGSAYIFRWNGNIWAQEKKLTALDAGAGNRFGNAVSANGDIVVVGALEDDCAGGPVCGSVYVFRFNGTTWLQEAKLSASDNLPFSYFGSAVSIDDDVIVVGAPQSECTLGPLCGFAYVYRFTGENWVEEQKLSASDSTAYGYFAYSVAVNASVIGIGAVGDPWGTTGGAAYFFRFNGSRWVEEAKVSAIDDEPSNLFGVSISIANDLAVVGAELDDCQGVSNCGAAYVFRHNGQTTSEWDQVAKLIGEAFPEPINLGINVSISEEMAILGSSRQDFSPQGTCCSAYIYYLSDCNTNSVIDGCDLDADGDGVPDDCDNCPSAFNDDQIDIDGDLVGDACDNCPSLGNSDQADSDGDAVGNVCDNCSGIMNSDQADADGDSVGDACDNCIEISNEGQANVDGDSFGDACDSCPVDFSDDIDGDGVCTSNDPCPLDNPDDLEPIRITCVEPIP